MLRRISTVAMAVAVFMALAVPAFATGTFDGEAEVGSFLTTIISAGWPIYMALLGGIVVIVLTSGAARAGLKKLSSLFRRVLSLIHI